ncbi:NAD(P)-binding domain-containing protein, partial [Priestia megaterium]
LGKMGYNLSLNLMDNHHEVVAYDVNKEAVEKLSNEGATGAFTVEELVNELPLSPKVVWIMVPAGEVTENVITELKELLSEGDIIIDGGNSNYKESVRRAQDLQEKG